MTGVVGTVLMHCMCCPAVPSVLSVPLVCAPQTQHVEQEITNAASAEINALRVRGCQCVSSTHTAQWGCLFRWWYTHCLAHPAPTCTICGTSPCSPVHLPLPRPTTSPLLQGLGLARQILVLAPGGVSFLDACSHVLLAAAQSDLQLYQSSMHEKDLILAAYMSDLEAAKSAAHKWQSANNMLEVLWGE